MLSNEANIQLSNALEKLIDSGIDLGGKILAAIVVLIVGKFIVNWLNRLFARMLEKRNVEPSVRTFLKSMVNILLVTVLFLTVVSTLGIELTSLAALLASVGVAIGMALSGNLQNFAGGIIILVFRPYKVGDYIESATGASGTVKEIQIFHTILITPDNRTVYAPNGAMSTSVVTNYSKQDLRRVDWVFKTSNSEDFHRVSQVIRSLIAADNRILKEPAETIALSELAVGTIGITVRAWVKSADYWDVLFDMNESVYATFKKEGIHAPVPHMTVKQA